MDLEIIILSEVSATKISIIWYSLSAKYFFNDTNEHIYKTETDSQRRNLLLPGGKCVRWAGIDWDFGMNMYPLLYLKQVNNQGFTM